MPNTEGRGPATTISISIIIIIIIIIIIVDDVFFLSVLVLAWWYCMLSEQAPRGSLDCLR